MNVSTQYDPLLYPRATEIRSGKADKKSGESFQSLLKNLVPKNHNPEISSDIFSKTPSREKIMDHVGESPDRRKMFEAARQFENFFLEKMFREMKKNMGKNDMLHGGQGEDIFQDMLLTERVNNMTKSATLGLAEQIYTQMMSREEYGDKRQ